MFDFPSYVHDLTGPIEQYQRSSRDIFACALFKRLEQTPPLCRAPVLICDGGDCNNCNPISDCTLDQATQIFIRQYFARSVALSQALSSELAPVEGLSSPAAAVAEVKMHSSSHLLGCAANNLLHPAADAQKVVLPYLKSFRANYNLKIGFHV